MKTHRPVEWRRELLLLGLIAMEAVWLAAFFLTLLRPEKGPSPAAIVGLIALILLVSSAVGRLLVRWRPSPWLHWGIMTLSLLLVLVILLVLRLLPVREQAATPQLSIDLVLSLLLVLVSWWRGNTLAQLDVASPNVVLVHFWIGLSVFFLTIILGEALLSEVLVSPGESLSVAPSVGIVGFIPAYFLVSLITLALARIEEVTQMPESTASAPRFRFWTVFVPGTAALLVGISLLLARFLSAGGVTWSLGWMLPVVETIGQVLQFISTLFLTVLEWLLALVLPALDWIVDLLPLEGFREATRALLETIQQLQQALRRMEEGQASRGFWIEVGKYVPAALLLLGFLLLGRAVRQQRRKEKDLVAEKPTYVSTAPVHSGGNVLRRGLDRLTDGLRGRVGFLYAVSVRRIYANLGRLAAQRGYPRPHHQTPFEYRTLLLEAFPEFQADVELITGAYVSAHYGQEPDTREKLAGVRAAWQRIRASA